MDSVKGRLPKGDIVSRGLRLTPQLSLIRVVSVVFAMEIALLFGSRNSPEIQAMILWTDAILLLVAVIIIVDTPEVNATVLRELAGISKVAIDLPFSIQFTVRRWFDSIWHWVWEGGAGGGAGGVVYGGGATELSTYSLESERGYAGLTAGYIIGGN